MLSQLKCSFIFKFYVKKLQRLYCEESYVSQIKFSKTWRKLLEMAESHSFLP